MRRLAALGLLAVGLGLGSAAGCQNNTIELDFPNEDDSGDGSGTGTGSDDVMGTTNATVPGEGTDTTPTTTGVGGPQTLLLAMDTPLAPGLPFQALVTTVPGDGTIDLTLQWLSLDIGSTTSPRQPVGDMYAYPAVPVEADGSFVWGVGVVLIPGAANPITGADTVVALTIAARPEGSPYCGEVGGTVLMPIETPIDGGTHAMTEVFDVNNLPVDFATSCF